MVLYTDTLFVTSKKNVNHAPIMVSEPPLLPGAGAATQTCSDQPKLTEQTKIIEFA